MLPQTEALLLEDVLLDARDGLVLSKQKLWYHFQRFPWNLENPEENPKFGEHSRQIRLRISQGLPQDHGSNFLPGSYHLGISPHIDSYYHLITDLLPHLIMGRPKPVLLPKWIPNEFKVFLQGCGFETKELGEDIFRVDRLELPPMPNPDWNPVKFRLVQNFMLKLLEERLSLIHI